MRAVLVVVVSGACLAVTAGASGAPSACTPGVRTVGGLDERTFCGPAKATVHYGSKIFNFAGGECDSTSTNFALNIGTVVLGATKKPKPNYFGLVVGAAVDSKPARHDGTYVGGVLALDHGGKGYLVQGTTLKITLTGNRSRGTFSGSSFFTSPSVQVTGTFSC